MILITSLFMHYLYMSVNKIDVTLSALPLAAFEKLLCMLCLQDYRMLQFQAKQGNTLS